MPPTVLSQHSRCSDPISTASSLHLSIKSPTVASPLLRVKAISLQWFPRPSTIGYFSSSCSLGSILPGLLSLTHAKPPKAIGYTLCLKCSSPIAIWLSPSPFTSLHSNVPLSMRLTPKTSFSKLQHQIHPAHPLPVTLLYFVSTTLSLSNKTAIITYFFYF